MIFKRQDGDLEIAYGSGTIRTEGTLVASSGRVGIALQGIPDDLAYTAFNSEMQAVLDTQQKIIISFKNLDGIDLLKGFLDHARSVKVRLNKEKNYAEIINNTQRRRYRRDRLSRDSRPNSNKRRKRECLRKRGDRKNTEF